MQEKVSAQYKNEIDMAKAQRDFELKKAAYDMEVNTKKAESEMAYQLQVQYYTLWMYLQVTYVPIISRDNVLPDMFPVGLITGAAPVCSKNFVTYL